MTSLTQIMVSSRSAWRFVEAMIVPLMDDLNVVRLLVHLRRGRVRHANPPTFHDLKKTQDDVIQIVSL